MFPIDIPTGTTLDGLVSEVIPQLHARFVHEPESGAELVAMVHARRQAGRDKIWTVTVRGPSMTVEDGERAGAPIWVSFDERVAEKFLADWTGPKKYFPKAAPPGGFVLLSDPRVMKRLAMASGRIELAIADFEGERIAMTAGFGAPAKKGIDLDDPDVVVETSIGTLQALVEGRLAPDAALSGGDVRTKGNRFVAMQVALALAPFFPVRA